MQCRMCLWFVLPTFIAAVALAYVTRLHDLIARCVGAVRIEYPVAKDSDPVRIGLLGASGIAQFAVVYPAGKCPHAAVHAVAARDRERAQKFARKQGIPVVPGSYEELIAHPDVDAVYISVVTELHHRWAKQALLANKHVLVEKPLTLSVAHATELRDLAEQRGLVLFEAFHYRYHPANLRLKEIVAGGLVGDVTSVECRSNMFDPKEWVAGALPPKAWHIKMLDRWCYCVDIVRWVLDAEELEVVSSTFGRAVEVELRGPGSVPVTFLTQKHVLGVPEWDLHIHGSRGSVHITNFLFPFVYHKIRVEVPGQSRVEQVYGQGNTTFEHQLEAFARAVKHGAAFPTTARNSVHNLRLAAKILEAGGSDLEGLARWTGS